MKKDLRQFEDLAKEIEVNGKKFVPIVELAKINDVEFRRVKNVEKIRSLVRAEYLDLHDKEYELSVNSDFDVFFYGDDGALTHLYKILEIYKKLAEWGFIPNELNETEKKTVSTFWIKPIIKKDTLVEAMNKAIEDILKTSMKQNQEKFIKNSFGHPTENKQEQKPKTYTVTEKQMAELYSYKLELQCARDFIYNYVIKKHHDLERRGFETGKMHTRLVYSDKNFETLLSNIKKQ